MRKHAGEPQLRMPLPLATFGTSCGDAQSPSLKRQRKDSAVCEASTTTEATLLLLADHWAEQVAADAPKEGLVEPSAAPPPPGQAAQALPVADLQTRNITSQRHQATQADGCPWEFRPC